MYSSLRICALVAVVALTVWTANAQSWRAENVEQNGIRHVMNTSTPKEPEQVLKSNERWRLDSESDVVIGVIAGAACDRAGNVYLLDVQLSEVHAVGPQGEYAGVIARSGEGPGEFYRGSGISLLDDQTLCITQVIPARAVRVTLTGKPLANHALPEALGTPYLNGSAAVGGRLAVRLDYMVQEETSFGLKTTFATLNQNGQIETTYWELFRSVDVANMEFDEKTDFEPVWAFGGDGRFYVADKWDAYAVQVIGKDGQVLYVVEREYMHRPRSKEEVRKVQTMIEDGEISPDTQIADTSPDVTRIVPRRDGSVWVLTSRGEMDVPSGTVATFDEFDSTGQYVRQVVVKGPFVTGRDAFLMCRDFVVIATNAGEFAAIRGGEDGQDGLESEIICLALGGDSESGVTSSDSGR